ncbi:MAG: LON peptidase substrate-binding domain-containing protein [Alphaproteobacteria bacterium]|nr:LON peptidase substrate-binding domain-containing protein [Alphaproteobacteria bacterium]
MSIFDPSFDDLPAILPVFPLSGALLLPHGMLPLNIFETRYLNMTADALSGERLIGMIQPRPRVETAAPSNDNDQMSDSGDDDSDDADEEAGQPDLFDIGCAGRIVRFEETDDGRYLINLKGVARFRVGDELALKDGFRRVRPDWSGFEADLREDDGAELSKERLLKSLRPYFTGRGIEANWDVVNDTPGGRLVNSLSMICPFEASEKQALLEAATLSDRLDVLTSLIEMAVLETSHEEHGRQ